MSLPRFLSPLLLACSVVAPLGAQGLSDAQIDAERARIDRERQANEARHVQERAACYQRFAVEDCLRESRRQLRSQTDDLRRQESALNDMQRKRRGAEQLQRLDEKQAAPAGPDARQRQEALDAQRAREERAADHARSRADMEAQAPQNRADFQARQRERAEDAASATQRRAEAPQARERYERKQADAQRRREEQARANAERQKPPAAPLPSPAQ